MARLQSYIVSGLALAVSACESRGAETDRQPEGGEGAVTLSYVQFSYSSSSLSALEIWQGLMASSAMDFPSGFQGMNPKISGRGEVSFAWRASCQQAMIDVREFFFEKLEDAGLQNVEEIVVQDLRCVDEAEHSASQL